MDLQLGARRYDVRVRPLVMGILNRTRDSFYDRGAHFQLDAFLRRAEQLVADGADLLDVGARAAGIGTRRVSEQEESDLASESIAALVARFDLPVSVDTWRSPVAAAAFEAGAVVGNDLSGFSDPAYLPITAAAGATIVATHIRLPPQVPDPDPHYDDVVEDVAKALAALGVRAEGAGIPRERILVDPGLDLGKTWQQSLDLLAGCDRFAAIGYHLLVAPSNKIFLGRLLAADKYQREVGTAAACAVAVHLGARVIRVHDARLGRHVAEVTAACLQRH
ncbi:MAG: dihydropteroate synthase [Actinomycetota bacterium]|nr:dihydropteroate synthase [Actinomycetota bacterium]